jgi:protein involved in polysaccharide export with SLBB domain
MNTNTSFPTRAALAAWLCLGLSSWVLPAQAQVSAAALLQAQTGASATPGATLGAMPMAAGAPAPALGLVQAPVLPQRPDIGAQDASRSPLTPLRAPQPQAPSQFQRFVQESTGKLLPVFGANLFDNPLAYAADSATAAPGEYLLGTGDEVRINISGALDYAGSQTVDRNGQISLPKIGTLNLAGVQVKDLEATVRKQVATVFTNVSVNASLGKLRGVTVYVVGQARQPGTYSLTSLSTLVNAVFASGGPGANGSLRQITLKRGGKTVTTLDLYDFIAKGDKGRDALLQPGDVITIPPAGPRVALTGATDLGAIYELKDGTTVQDLLAIGGGVPALASAQKALIERIDPQQAGAPRQVQNLLLNAQGLSQKLRDGDVITLLPISPAFGNAVTLQGAVAQPLRHGWHAGMRVADLIPDREALISPDFYKRRNQLVQNRIATLRAQGFTAEQIQALQRAEQLPEDMALSTELIARNPFFGQNTPAMPQGQTQQGQGAAPQPGTGGTASANTQNPNTPALSEQELQILRDRRNQEARNPVDRVRGFSEQINWEYAVIQRLNKAELRTELIPFNLAKAVIDKDPAHNLQLQPDDVVTIMSSADLRLPVAKQTRLVRIEGEVASPGVYQAKPGETITQLIQRAGGVTPQAYLYGIEFTRETVRKQQQQNLDQLIRRLEAQMQSAGATLAANLTGERALQSQTLQQQQQQQMQAQINRLKTLRSKGRVALELDADVQKADALPALPLEDGDAILIPSQPAFVSAAGSVNNENVMIYRPGRTVGDVLKAAGLAEDAEPSEAFVLRADGSVLSRRSSGWLSSFEGAKVMPGDTLVVPPKVDRETNYNFVVRALRDWTQIFSNLGIGAAAIKTLRN